MRGDQYVLEPAKKPIASMLTQNLSPRFRCSTDRLITAKDHAAIQISVADVDENGVAQNTSTSFAVSGQVRAMGESDDSINRLATKAGREFLRFSVIGLGPNVYQYVSLGCLVDFNWDFSEHSAQKRLVVSKVDIGSCSPRYFSRCTHAIEALFFPHLEFWVFANVIKRAELPE